MLECVTPTFSSVRIATTTVDTEVRPVADNQPVYIPPGALHRLEKPGKMPMVLIEIRTGFYVSKDDITRYDDVCARDQSAKG
ncbi:hypothetical protein [Celeribacter persicus]|jgi:Mannose-6-phosphate isomerase|uniref:Mannose-6-phosphate isomerase n=1 Tax=Celeribacter persicus TaxID=1651082 RepID=A0A2T5HGV0_9RHOB|nr:mannose-6-phosphate isomerase [Celeribacter persicus]